MLSGDIFLQAHNEQQRCGTHITPSKQLSESQKTITYSTCLLVITALNLLDGHIWNVHAISWLCDLAYIYEDTGCVHANKMLCNHKPQKCTNCMHKKLYSEFSTQFSSCIFAERAEIAEEHSSFSQEALKHIYVYFTISDVVCGEDSCFGCTLSGCFYTNTGKNMLTSAFRWLAEDWRFVCFIHKIIEYI